MYTFDASTKKPLPPPIKRKGQDSPFANKSKGISNTYERILRGVAREVGKLVKGYMSDDPLNPDLEDSLTRALRAYSEILGPWALHVCNNVFRSVDNQDKFAWRQHTKQMAVALREEIQNAPTGDVLKEIMQQNITLIKSIPTQAAERVHKLILLNMSQSNRAADIAKMIMASESVAKSRAENIASTEVSKAGVALTQARATYVGSEGYVWRTVGDLVVRRSHRKMNGVFCRWDNPPLINEGSDKKPNMIAHHAGAIWRCRCWPDVQIPEG